MGILFTIKGCQFESTFTKGFDAYWIKDGNFYKRAEIEKARFQLINFKDLRLQYLTAEHNGSYKCALKLSGKPLQLSKPLDVVLEGKIILHIVFIYFRIFTQNCLFSA